MTDNETPREVGSYTDDNAKTNGPWEMY